MVRYFAFTSVTTVSPAKTTEQIEMPFGNFWVWTLGGGVNEPYIRWARPDPSTERDTFFWEGE